VVAGQPGSGKSSLQNELKKQLGLTMAVKIDTDEFRVYHPRWLHLSRLDDRTAADRTHIDAKRWTAMAVNHAATQRYDIILSATLKSPLTARRLLSALREADYHIIVAVIAVHASISRLSILNRYMRQRALQGFGRYVPGEMHDSAYTGVLESVDLIDSSTLADEVMVLSRNRVDDFTYHNYLDSVGQWRRPAGTRQSILWERERRWLVEDYQWFQQIDIELRETLPSDLLPELDEVRQLAERFTAEMRERTAVQPGHGPGSTSTATVTIPRQRFPFHDTLFDDS
jgi:predicted ABC-type ATPase